MALLVAMALAMALSSSAILVYFTIYDFERTFLAITAVVTIAVATPIIFYAQNVIRQLRDTQRMQRALLTEVVHARDEAQQANAFKSRFLANLSHELRTPLNSIIGFSSLLEEQAFGPLGDARYLGYIKDISLGGTHLLDLINDILALSKMEAGATTPDNDDESDVDEVIFACMRMVQPLAQARSVRIETKGAANKGLVVSERMLRQILLNILSNAVKFTLSGGLVRLSVETRPGGALAILIADSGVGMSDEDIGVALTPFGQIHNDAVGSQEGTGLGLPLVKAMMALHGGLLQIDSAPGEGTVVSLLFPPNRVVISSPLQRISV
ncbi:MAG TPA: HAMP domain-containing sensor histidine kinase [Parvibaculum sp.]